MVGMCIVAIRHDGGRETRVVTDWDVFQARRDVKHALHVLHRERGNDAPTQWELIAMAKAQSVDVYVITVDGEVDQVGEGKANAAREVKDLKRMDCGKVQVKWFDNWADAEAYEDKLRGY